VHLPHQLESVVRSAARTKVDSNPLVRAAQGCEVRVTKCGAVCCNTVEKCKEFVRRIEC
jgi:hypothetical protein